MKVNTTNNFYTCQRVAFLYRERERESIIYIFLNLIIESKNRHSDIHTCLSALYPCRYHVDFAVSCRFTK